MNEDPAAAPERRVPLNEQRHEAVLAEVLALGPDSVVDMGCGSGKFLSKLLRRTGVGRIAGCDVSVRDLQTARERLHVDDMTQRQSARIDLFQSALTYTDPRLEDFDVAILMEVVEHLDPPRLDALEHAVFGFAAPRSVIVTTPNSEYNALYEDLSGMRHPDHRFEWTRDEFAAWSDRVAAENGYDVRRSGIGEADESLGTPTQMAVFTRA